MISGEMTIDQRREMERIGACRYLADRVSEAVDEILAAGARNGHEYDVRTFYTVRDCVASHAHECRVALAFDYTTRAIVRELAQRLIDIESIGADDEYEERGTC